MRTHSPPDPIIDPCWDPVFKGIFTKKSPQSERALLSLLSAMLEQNLQAVSITANEPPVALLGDRQIRYDINCVLDGGKQANVEMTLHPTLYEPLKMEYYAGRLHTSQPIQGRGRSFKDLQESYQLSFLGNRRLFPDPHFYHHFVYYDPRRSLALGGRTAIIVVELDKLTEILRKPARDMHPRERWAVFFRYYTDPARRKLIKTILREEEGIEMADAIMHEFTAAELAYFHEISKEKYELDLRAHWDEAEERGRAEGIQMGREEGIQMGMDAGRAEGETWKQLEIARRMKAMGDTTEKIAFITGLSLEAVEGL